MNKTASQKIENFRKLAYDYDSASLSNVRTELVSNCSKYQKQFLDVGEDVGYRIYCKGASEIVLARCDYLIGADGNPYSFTFQRLKKINATVIFQMANNELKTIYVAFKNFIRIDAREALKGEIPFGKDEEIDWNDEEEMYKNFVGVAICGIQASR